MPLVSEPSPSRASRGSGVAVCGSFLPLALLASLSTVVLVWSEVVVEVLLCDAVLD